MKNPHTPNLTWIGSWPEIWPHEYLISPTEMSVKLASFITVLEPGQFTLISMGLIRYQKYLGPPWTDSHQIWAVDVFYSLVSKILKCKKSFLWCHRFCTLYMHVSRAHLITDLVHIQIPPTGYIGLTLRSTPVAIARWSTFKGTLMLLWQ